LSRNHRGKRNQQKKKDHQTLYRQRALERKFVYTYSFNDTEKAEIVCTTPKPQILTYIKENLYEGEPLMIHEPTGFDGLILFDTFTYSLWQNANTYPGEKERFV